MPHRPKRPKHDPAAAQWIKELTPIGLPAGTKAKSSDGEVYVVSESGAIVNTTRSRLSKKQRHKEREWRKQMKMATKELAAMGR